MKIGTEVEGRFKGLLTLFLDADEAIAFFNRPSLVKAVDDPMVKEMIPKVRHIYISDHGNKLSPDEACITKWGELGFVVCIERTHVYNMDTWPPYVSIMLVIESSSFWNLRNIDQVKFTLNKLVACAPVESMIATRPEDFANDIEIKVNE